MKKLILIFSFLIGHSLISQEHNIKGTYSINLIETKNDTIKYNLDLKSDGSFFFHSYTYHKNGIPTIVHKYGKGKWTMSNLLVYFATNKKIDIDKKHQLDFTNTRARFITKHPRDISNKVVNTRLQFYESDISWIQSIEMLKQ